MTEKFLNIIKKSKYAVVLTGAGISVESGIPPFRGKEGLWTKYDPEEYATREAFERDPVKVWKFLAEGIDLVLKVKPNPAHLALAKLEELGYIKSIITQNIDNLHQRAGSKNVIEVHGNTLRLICTQCKHMEIIYKVPDKVPPICPECSGMVRQDIVLFGEILPPNEWEKAIEETRKADTYLVIGTSGVVMPAAMLPMIAKGNRAFIVEVNPEQTAITSIADLYIGMRAGEFFKKVLEKL
jgi:NAD-dependent deacetylase